MSLVIWKYLIDPDETVYSGVQEIEFPGWSQVLSFGTQGEEAYVWVMVETEGTRPTRRTFRAFLTGIPIKGNPGDFIGTATTESGIGIHLFQVACKTE